MKPTTILAGILIIIALAAGAGYLLFSRNRGTTVTSSASCPPASQLPASLTIKYENNKFVAEEAQAVLDSDKAIFCVRKGATVTFAGPNLWVGSDPHPIHTGLPGFDAKAVKDTYSFTFDKVGEWGFHNHVRASDRGTIIVVE